MVRCVHRKAFDSSYIQKVMTRLTSFTWPAEGVKINGFGKRLIVKSVLTMNLNVSVRWDMERGIAVSVIALGTKACQP